MNVYIFHYYSPSLSVFTFFQGKLLLLILRPVVAPIVFTSVIMDFSVCWYFSQLKCVCRSNRSCFSPMSISVDSISSMSFYSDVGGRTRTDWRLFILPDVSNVSKQMGLQHLVNLCHKSIFFFWTEVWRGIDAHRCDENQSHTDLSLAFPSFIGIGACRHRRTHPNWSRSCPFADARSTGTSNGANRQFHSVPIDRYDQRVFFFPLSLLLLSVY